MKRIALAAALLAVPVLSGCVIIDADEDDDFSVDFDHSSTGTVFGATVYLDRVEFLVTSNGCTDESYFDLDIDHHGNGKVSLELDRIKTDNCRAFLQEGTTVSWTFEDIGIPAGSKVTIENQVARR